MTRGKQAERVINAPFAPFRALFLVSRRDSFPFFCGSQNRPVQIMCILLTKTLTFGKGVVPFIREEFLN
jgi:hypothetical protein